MISHGDNCSFTIISEDPCEKIVLKKILRERTVTFYSFAAKHVAITVTHMNLVSCSYGDNTVFIYNGETAQAPLIGQYCGDKIPRMISGGSAVHIVLLSNPYRFFFTYSVLDSGELLLEGTEVQYTNTCCRMRWYPVF